MPTIAGGNPVPLGKVTVAVPGTLIKLTVNFPDMDTAAVGQPLHAAVLFIQALPGNIGPVYLGTVGLVRATGVGVYVSLAAGEGFTLSVQGAANPFNILDYRLDADAATDAVFASFTVV